MTLSPRAARSGTGEYRPDTVARLIAVATPQARLIPIFDRARISKALGVDHRHSWEAVWCALRDPEVQSRLQDVQASVAGADDLSLLRILDIVVWMSREQPPPAK
jgi:hypothetical protein